MALWAVCVCLFVSLRNTHFQVSWSLLVEECIPTLTATATTEEEKNADSNKKREKSIGASLRIGRQNQCLPYTRFLHCKQSESMWLSPGYWIKNPAYGRHRISRPMRIVGPIKFWRGCVIYIEEKKWGSSRVHASTRRIHKWAMDALHPPRVFRAPRVGDGRSAPTPRF